MKKILTILATTLFILSGYFVLPRNTTIQLDSKSEANISSIIQVEDSNTNDEELKEKIGQMIIAGFRGTDFSEESDVAIMINQAKIGGVIFFDYDVPEKSFNRNIKNQKQVEKIILDLQNYSKIPLFIAIDAEGGKVNRLKSEYGFLDIISAEKMGEDPTTQITFKESLTLAYKLKTLGFNMNFAPVVDLNLNPKNPAIGNVGRSFSRDPNEVVNHASVFISNLQENNIIGVAKHFPGQGSSHNDTHTNISDITNYYDESELIPYFELNEKGLLKAVMSAHLLNKNVDEIYPATLSEKFLTNILREKIGFKGVIISDDLQMSAINGKFSLETAVVLAINAGNDIILVSNNTKSGYAKNAPMKIRDIIFEAIKSGKIKKERIEESYERIMMLKKDFIK